MKTHAGVIVVAAVDDAEKIQRVMRGVNASAIVIPPEFPQTPNKAYTLAVDQIKKLEKKQSENTKQMTAFTKKNRSEILALHERCTVAKDVLEHLRKPGGTKRFAVIRGYIPSKMEEKFKKICLKWTAIIEEPAKDAKEPVLLDNPRFVRTFETITDSQGFPKKGELDPTPMIAIMWPIFYGIMFADLGRRTTFNGTRAVFFVKGHLVFIARCFLLKLQYLIYSSVYALFGVWGNSGGITIADAFTPRITRWIFSASSTAATTITPACVFTSRLYL